MADRGRSGTVLKRPSAVVLKNSAGEAALLAGPFSAAGYLLKLSNKRKWQKR